MSKCVTVPSMLASTLLTLGPTKACFAKFSTTESCEKISLRANPVVQWFYSVSLRSSQATIATGNEVWHSMKATAVKTSTNS